MTIIILKEPWLSTNKQRNDPNTGWYTPYDTPYHPDIISYRGNWTAICGDLLLLVLPRMLPLPASPLQSSSVFFAFVLLVFLISIYFRFVSIDDSLIWFFPLLSMAESLHSQFESFLWFSCFFLLFLFFIFYSNPPPAHRGSRNRLRHMRCSSGYDRQCQSSRLDYSILSDQPPLYIWSSTISSLSTQSSQFQVKLKLLAYPPRI